MRQSCAENYEVCRQVWRRVDPQQDPYPEEMGNMERNEKASWQGLRILEELAARKRQERRLYLACARQISAGGLRRQLNQLAAEKEGQAHRLLAAGYLLTGQPLQVPLEMGEGKREPWRQTLRRRWFEEMESAGQLEEMSGQIPLLGELLRELAGEERRHAGMLLRMLAQSLAY